VWWIDGKLTLEREMACDDLVLAKISNPRTYAKSLLSLAERVGLGRESPWPKPRWAARIKPRSGLCRFSTRAAQSNQGVEASAGLVTADVHGSNHGGSLYAEFSFVRRSQSESLDRNLSTANRPQMVTQ
jgi:hypothetical protein